MVLLTFFFFLFDFLLESSEELESEDDGSSGSFEALLLLLPRLPSLPSPILLKLNVESEGSSDPFNSIVDCELFGASFSRLLVEFVGVVNMPLKMFGIETLTLLPPTPQVQKILETCLSNLHPFD